MSQAVEMLPPGPEALRDAWELAQSGAGFVPWLAREFAYSGLPREDLEAEATLGLFDAAMRFDRSHGVRFLTYASWWARRRMQTLVLRQGRIVRRPATRTGAPVPGPRDVSLDDPVGVGARQLWGDVIENDRELKPIDAVLEGESMARLARAMDELPDSWRYVVERRYGLDGAAPKTLAWLGARLRISRERVRQLEVKALTRLRRSLERSA